MFAVSFLNKIVILGGHEYSSFNRLLFNEEGALSQQGIVTKASFTVQKQKIKVLQWADQESWIVTVFDGIK